MAGNARKYNGVEDGLGIGLRVFRCRTLPPAFLSRPPGEGIFSPRRGGAMLLAVVGNSYGCSAVEAFNQQNIWAKRGYGTNSPEVSPQ